jgi:hypothetical protein
MPTSGELRLRALILALVALGGIWIGVFIQRSQSSPLKAVTFAAGPRPVKVPAQKLVHVDGLDRPAAAKPVAARTTPRVRPNTRIPARQTPNVPAVVTPVARKHAPKPAMPPKTEPIPEDNRSAAESPPPPLEPLAISNVQVVDVTSSGARVAWQTNVPTQAQTAFGLDTPTVWAQPSGQSLIEHQSVISGLEFSTTYHVYLHAMDEWNRAQTVTATLTTEPMPDHSSAITSSGHIVVDDRPFFGTAVWAQCSDGIGSNIADGINLFMGYGCSKDDSGLAARLGGRAYSVVNADDADTNGHGLIGWYYPDEWDAFLEGSITRQDLAKSIIAPRTGRISFLTLTNHFYSHASALPNGKGMYPLLMSIPDVIGFDLYPLQVWCRPAFSDVMDSQQELGSASGGKPTFQWIEVAPMEHACRDESALDPTPDTVRAETWLAVAGGASVVGYFPNRWSTTIGSAIAQTNHQLKALAPALLAPAVQVSSDAPAVRVSGRTLNGATYVIAVNTSSSTVQAKVSVPGIGGRSPVVFGGGSVIGADDQGFTDSFGPLAAHVYIIPPAGWS